MEPEKRGLSTTSPKGGLTIEIWSKGVSPKGPRKGVSFIWKKGVVPYTIR